MSERTDTERLEWLVNRSARIVNHGPEDNCPKTLLDCAENTIRRGKDFRKMIDRAMDAEERP